MRKASSRSVLIVASCLAVMSTASGDGQTRSSPADQTPATPPYAILHAPAGVKEGDKWIPEMPAMESLAPPAGWKPDGLEVPWMPATLLRLPRTNITRAKYPAIDFHDAHRRAQDHEGQYKSCHRAHRSSRHGRHRQPERRHRRSARRRAEGRRAVQGSRRELHHLQRGRHQRAGLVAEIRRGDGARPSRPARWG